MNRLEGEARSILTVLIQGTPAALDWEHLRIVARWLTLKALVLEHAAPKMSLTPRNDRIAFKDDDIIPPYFRIYLGSNGSAASTGLNRHSLCVALGPTPKPDPPLAGTFKNVQTLSLILGRAFAHITSARIANFDLETRLFIPALYRNRIWPPSVTEMVLPTQPVFTTPQIDQIADSLNVWTGNSTIRWIRDAPDGR